MNEYRLDSSISNAAPVPQPNFDDERTVLAARRVVPLEQIDAKVRHRRQWFLGGAFAMAMLMGAASALVAAYLRQRTVPTPGNEVSQMDIASAPLAVAESLAGEDSPVLEATEEPAPLPLETPIETPKKASAVKRRLVVKPVEEILEPLHTGKISEDEQLHQIRDAILYDEWQERRARRVLRRERRRLDRYNHRDLSNLDEIFEGRRRP